MTMRNLKLRVITLVTIMAVPAMIWAQNDAKSGNNNRQRGECQQMREHRGPVDHMKALNLTDDQKQKIEKLQFDHQKKVLGLKNQLGEKRAKLRTLTTADTPDTKAINALVDEMGALKTQLMKERVNMQLSIRALLTDEQKLKFDMRGKGKGMRGEFGPNHRERGQGDGYGPQHGMDDPENADDEYEGGM